jgi:hypothetical protein
MTQRELMAALQISASGLEKMINLGCPYRVVRHRRQFDLEQVQTWRKENITPKPGPELAEGRLRLQHLRNEEREFKLALLKGEYVLKSKVDTYMFETGRQIRDAVLGVPDRLAGIMAAETDQHKIHALLTQEFLRALESLSHSDATWRDGGV